MFFCRFSSAILLISLQFCNLAWAYPNNWDLECKWIEKPHTAAEKSDLTKLKLWEECIMLNVSNTFLNTYKKSNPGFGVSSDNFAQALYTTRPTEDMVINLHQLQVTNLAVNEQYRQVSVNGLLIMSWIDHRLAWDPAKMGLNTIRLHQLFGNRRVWFPKLSNSAWMDMTHSQRLSNIPSPSDTILGAVPTISHTGNVTLKIHFADNMQNYAFSYKHYPYDVQNPCFSLHVQASEPMPEKLVFKIVGAKPALYSADAKKVGQGHFWKTLNMGLKPGEESGFKLCVKVARIAPSARIELFLPVVLTVVLSVFAPFFGTFRYQAAVKVLALVLQYMCTMELTERTKELLFGDQLPNLLLFHEFALITTMVSLLFTLMLWTVKRKPHKAAPPYMLTDLADRFNGYFSCTSFPDDDREELIETRENGGQQTVVNVKQQWDSAIQFVGNLFFVLFTLVMLVGLIALGIP